MWLDSFYVTHPMLHCQLFSHYSTQAAELHWHMFLLQKAVQIATKVGIALDILLDSVYVANSW